MGGKGDFPRAGGWGLVAQFPAPLKTRRLRRLDAA
ncbi:hypothetical protein BN159_3965 [Streptomyces davaonensis JCM 4913]|uniref:Uncharacterized protein n=1 Tax=Streptomyces davaonensis (strain DSM 101723 / JCM 4913 / KCC S-0913 / 768) TaxID=1214101 RepID=K4R6N1_STRDJ|nr:hypothetical protein BN159_3965 [Streptomyces davaonensis JCM 4913]